MIDADARLGRIWSPIRLTLALASITTVILLIVGTPHRVVARALAGALEGGGRRRGGAAARAAADGAGLLSPGRARARAGRAAASQRSWALRTLAFTFEGLVIGSVIYSMPFVVQPIRNAFEAIGERPLEVAATLRASPLGRLLVGRGAAGAAGLPDRRRARLRPYGRRVRRRADDRRQHSGRDQGAVGRHLRLRRDAAMDAGAHPGGRHAGLLLRRHPGHDGDREARSRGPGHERRRRDDQRAAFAGGLGQLRARRRVRAPMRGDHRAVRSVRLRQDHDPALRRGPAAARRPLRRRRRRLAGRRTARSCRRIERPVGYVFQEASLFAAPVGAAQPALRAQPRA